MHGFTAAAEAAAHPIAIHTLPAMNPARLVANALVRTAYRLKRRVTRAPHNAPQARDRLLLERTLADLAERRAIEYAGEYGAEITTFIPFVAWLKSRGHLAGRRLVTYRGMRPYYFFLDDSEYDEKPGPRDWAPIATRTWPTNSTYSAIRRPWHVYPDFRARYRAQGPTFSRPVLFIQNKFVIEQGVRPVNFLTLKALDRLLAIVTPHFDVVYSRPRALAAANGYVADRNDHCDYPDLSIVRRYADVLDLEAFCAQEQRDYNLTKLEILAKAHVFVAVQGGGSHILACFDRSLMLMFDLESGEFPHAYGLGPYKYLADPAPVIMLARCDKAFERGLDALAGVRVQTDTVRIARDAARVIQSMRI